MSRIKQLFRILFISLLGLIGVALILAGGRLAWQGGDVGGVLMVMAAGGMLAGCAWWLLFLEPTVSVREPATNPDFPLAPNQSLQGGGDVASNGKHGINPALSSDAAAHEDEPAPVRVATRHQRLTPETQLQSATPDELRAALLGIGLRRIAGATWQEACADERWASYCVFLHCERDKLDAGSSDDVDGLYLTLEEAEAAVSASPQAANSYTWKVFVSALELQYASDDRKVLPHLVRAIKKELLALPARECPGTPVELKSWQDGKKAWLDTSGQNIVLFEDENVLKDSSSSNEPKTGAFKTDYGMGLFDASGAVVLPPRYEDIDPFSYGLAAAKLNGLWGFLDRQAHWQIEPRFVEVYGFGYDDLCKARTENGWGMIDKQGAWIVADRYTEIGWFSRYRGGLNIAAIRKTEEGLWGAIQVGADENSSTHQGDEPGVVGRVSTRQVSLNQPMAVGLKPDLQHGAAPAVYQETLVVDCMCATEDEVEERVHDYLEALRTKTESISKLDE